MNSTTFRSSRSASQAGFSLIEVMIAALVLATGLMALATLQTNLARNAADSRARSQISAFVDLVLERQRAVAATGFADVPSNTQWTTAELADVAASAGVSNLAVAVTSTHYDGRTGSFVVCDATCAAALGSGEPQYKELRTVATWTDGNGQARRYDMTSTISPRSSVDSTIPYSAPTNGNPANAASPIVRTPSPVQAGVIPVAIGDSQDTAATNPKPTIQSGNVIRTSFEVLTYRNESDSVVRQQRRVETAVVACQCAQNAAPTGAQFEDAQWPAYWTGERYSIFQPTAGGDPPGKAALTGPATGVTQDVLCKECCRDHHDTATTGVVKFDPFRNDTHRHYKLTAGTLELAGSGDNYLEACRMIRVDGFWRTAQDLRASHFGLLETESFATSPVPFNNTDAPINSPVEKYERFVLTFLDSNYRPGQTAQVADTIYETEGLNAPATIAISRPTPVDERYLHARGLYVDNIETDTQNKITAAANACTRANPAECVLPLLPFTSINVTEAAFWSAADTNRLVVDSDGFVVFAPENPNRGRVNALSTAQPSNGTDVNTRIQKSNSGIVVRDRGIDPTDDVDLTDAQTFEISGGAGGANSGTFTVTLTGLPAANRSPGISWVVGTAGNNCQGPSPYTCTTSVALGVAASVTVAAYNQQVQQTGTASITCPNSPGNAAIPSTHTYTASGQNRLTYCVNYSVSSINLSGTAGTITNSGAVGDPNTGAGAERTQVNFATLADGASVQLGFTQEGRTLAPIQQCTFKNNGNLNTVTFANCP